MNSKQRRQALRITQGPRSRASLAAPPSHASLYANHLGLGGTYSSAIEDWLLTRNKTVNSNHFLLSDSVPDLSAINDNNGMSTNHSTPKKIPIHNRNGNIINGYQYSHQGSPNYYPQHSSPSSRMLKNKNLENILIEDDEEVQLRRSNGRYMYEPNDNDIKDNWMYRKPNGPHDRERHSSSYFILNFIIR